jgi:hypothetical protein
LRRILDEYRARAAELAKADPPYPRAGVADLLADTERQLLSALDGPELVALRDFVVDLFARAREALDREPAAGSAAYRESSLALASSTARMGAARLARGRAGTEVSRRWIEQIGKAIERIFVLAEAKDLSIDLCIKSTPPGARFSMHHKSGPDGPPALPTDGRLLHLSRGLYVYTVRKTGFKEIDNELDLVMDSRPVLACQLIASTAGDEALCRRQAGTIEECPP